MSFRYASGIKKPGFNSLAAPTVTSYIYNLFSWGRNDVGQLALGNTTSYSSPKQVGASTDWSLISGANNQYHFLAIKTNGTMWSWGNNLDGRLGLNDTTTISSPVQIGALTTWSNVFSGQRHCTAIKTDGTIWTWGQGFHGALGLGDIDNRSSPVQIGALTTWLTIAAGYRHALAIKTNGTLWSWGKNSYGSLGQSDTTDKSAPTQVGALTNWLTVSAGYSSTLAISN